MKYKCKICGKVSDGELWDEETRDNYDEDEPVSSILNNKDNAYFYCPQCYGEMDGRYIKKSIIHSLIAWILGYTMKHNFHKEYV